MSEHFFAYQHRALRPLLIWGALNTLLGTLITLRSQNPFWRHVGMQAASWGAIDAGLALAGQRGAAAKAAQHAAGSLVEGTEHTEARNLHRILWINFGLDILYILSGWFLFRRSPDRLDRQGMGVGIAVQGLFLLLFDGLLARDVARRWLD